MLIHCAACEDRKRIAEPDVETLVASASRPRGFVRVARNASLAELEPMDRALVVHELAVDDARNGFRRAEFDEMIEQRMFAKGTARFDIERLHALERKVGVLEHAVAPLRLLYGGRTPPISSKSDSGWL